MSIFIVLFIVVPTLLFAYWVYQKPTSLLTGFWFLYFLGGLTLMLFIGLESLNQTLAFIFAVPIALLLIGVALFGIFAMIIALFWNERVLLKYERPSIGNLLPLIIAFGLILLELLLFFLQSYTDNMFLLSLFGFINGAFLYFAIVFILFGLTLILYSIFPIRVPVDYIIVLGAGLNKDKVTPLLAARIEAGIKLYEQQLKRFNHRPTIILSGGQGADEAISEAQAMKNYIDEQGYVIDKLYLEDKSTNTKENLLFSEHVASHKDRIDGLATKKVVVATSNYHLLRAGKLAEEHGLKVRGRGAKTRLYYLPTAFIREYIGYLVMTKAKHIMMIIFIFFLSLFPILSSLL